jgi:hypothetical protein
MSRSRAILLISHRRRRAPRLVSPPRRDSGRLFVVAGIDLPEGLLAMITRRPRSISTG